MLSSKGAVLVITCILTFKRISCIAQEVVFDSDDESSFDCNDTEMCEPSWCIGKYGDLQSYILSSKDILNNLTETFFGTREDPARFVEIYYEFQASNSSNETDEIVCCGDHKELYIWSMSSIYLLGPRALQIQTLFAVNIGEKNITIRLPCLCNNVSGKLLSRLTYLVRCMLILLK